MSGLSPDSQIETVLPEPGEGSAVRSHQSYESQVHAVCHHSGQYLTLDETYPKWINPLRQQHDFPGIPELDDEFAQAAHAQNHQHRVWSKPGIAGVALVISNLLLLFLMTRVLARRDQVTTDVTEFVLFYTLVIVSAIVGIGLLIWGAWSIANRKAIYHRKAIQHNQPPEITDFPLLYCKYEIAAHEYLDVNLGNDQLISPEDAKRTLHGRLTVNLHPDNASQENCKIYLQRYAQHNIADDLHLHAGTLALEHVANVDFDNQPAELIHLGHRTVMPAPIEFDHRIVMRARVPRSFMEGSYTKEDGPLVTITVPYRYRPPARRQEQDERQRFALECLPKLNSYDSYTLELHFRWQGNSNQKFFLDECRLEIPPELESVDKVERGRFDARRREVIWRNLMFKSQASQPGNGNTTQEGTLTKRVGASAADESQPRTDDLEQTLVLRVSFSEPLLEHHPILEGSYRCSFDGLFSGMSVSSERIWSTRGLKVTEDDKESIPIIQRLTTIKGDITVDISQLSQRHENVHPISIPCSDAPDRRLVHKILRALIECDVDLQRIEQAIPRLDPAGGLRTRLHYWEIVGRRYDRITLESIDVHVVISGYDQTIQETSDLPRTQIDLRLRCTHDPRNRTVPDQAMSLHDELVEKLQVLQDMPG